MSADSRESQPRSASVADVRISPTLHALSHTNDMVPFFTAITLDHCEVLYVSITSAKTADDFSSLGKHTIILWS